MAKEKKESKKGFLKSKVKTIGSLIPKQKQVSLHLGKANPNLYIGSNY